MNKSNKLDHAATTVNEIESIINKYWYVCIEKEGGLQVIITSKDHVENMPFRYTVVDNDFNEHVYCGNLFRAVLDAAHIKEKELHEEVGANILTISDIEVMMKADEYYRAAKIKLMDPKDIAYKAPEQLAEIRIVSHQVKALCKALVDVINEKFMYIGGNSGKQKETSKKD